MTETTITLRHPAGRAIAWKMDLDPDFVSDHHILEYVARLACYEPEVAWVMMRALRAEDNCVDVGACVGFFTLLMSQLVGPKGTVVSVEPSPDNLERLKRNLDLNLHDNPISNVSFVEQPLAARAEEVAFYRSADSSGGHALWPPERWHENVKTQEMHPAATGMTATTLNRITPDPCRLIKLDTEGAEERILQGGADVLRNQHPPFIVAEMNAFGLDQMGCSSESLRGFMRLHGYDTFALYPDGATPELVPPRRGVECPHVFNVLFSSPEAVASIWKCDYSTRERHNERI